jgi:hypothetical protein
VESTLPVTDTSTDTPCPESERLVTTASVTPKTTNSNSVLPKTASNDIQQHVNSVNSTDSDSCAPEVMVPDARVFSSMKNEQKYPWLYDIVVHKGYLCKFCEQFYGHSSSSQDFTTDRK